MRSLIKLLIAMLVLLGLRGVSHVVAAAIDIKCNPEADPCMDPTYWKMWDDVDKEMLLLSPGVVLDCDRVHPRVNGTSYEMDGPHGLATHTEIVYWFTMSKQQQHEFNAYCKSKEEKNA